MAEKTNVDVAFTAKSASHKSSCATNGGESSTAGVQLSQSSPSSVIEDSGTESGEDLRLLNPELLAEVRGALSKLENALPTLDTVRRASIIPLVNKLQSCLKVSAETASSIPSLPGSSATAAATLQQPITSSSPSLISSSPASSSTITTATPSATKRFANKQRKTRHTVGVSKAELADARKWIAENFLEDSIPPSTASAVTTNPLRYESKAYKPVKFTPIPPREHRHEPSKYPLDYGYFETPPIYQTDIVDPPTPMLAHRSYNHLAAYPPPAANNHRPLRKQNFSSDEGDVSSTEEETVAKMEIICPTAKPWLTGSSQYDKKVPLRFHQKNNKKIRMKRANTIDIPKLCDIIPTSSGDESAYRSADEQRKRDKNAAYRPDPAHEKLPPPTLQPRTDKDRKFVDFVRQTMRDDQQSKMIAYNPSAAGGGQWSNRFTHIKCAFEQPMTPGNNNARKSTSSPDIFKLVSTKVYPPAVTPKSSFSHAHSSPFKPVPPSRVTLARDSGYESRRNSYHHYDHQQIQNLPKQFFTALESQALQQQQQKQQQRQLQQKTPKTYYAPTNASVPLNTLPCQQQIPFPYNLGGYLSDSSVQYPHHHTNAFLQQSAYVPTKLNVPDNVYYTQPTYFYQESPTASGIAFISPPTIPVSYSSSPTNHSYASLPTSPLPPASCPDYCEERPAMAKIMGQPQQAVVVPNKSNYRQSGSAGAAAAGTTSTINLSSGHQNFKKAPSTQQSQLQRSTFLTATDKMPPPIRKQVRIIALNDDKENLPEQFHVLNQRNKFESMSGGSDAPQPLPPQINEKAFFKPLTAASISATTRGKRPTVVAATAAKSSAIVEQSRSPPQSPIVMPSVLQKSESWHQMIMERTKQARPPSPIKLKVQRAKSTHNLATIPKQYEAVLNPESVQAKKQTVEQFMGKLSTKTSHDASHLSAKTVEKQSSAIGSTAVTTVNDDLKQVDEEFEMLFKEASGKKT